MNNNIFELHYYFRDNSHSIDSTIRNKCESEILAIINEAANLLEVELTINSIVPMEGGFRDLWNLIGNNSNQVTLLLAVLTLVMSRIPTSDPEMERLDRQIKQLTIEEKKLTIERLKREAETEPSNTKVIEKIADVVDRNLKITKRKSNLYSHLSTYHKVTRVGFNAKSIEKSQDNNYERSIYSRDFHKFILKTNKLSSIKDNNASIEIISPVLKEGRYKWKGIYNNIPISFDMNDHDFREDVLLEKHSFKHGSNIKCELSIGRELNEVGDVIITGYTVKTVIEFDSDGNTSVTTPQGLNFKQAKKYSDSQGELF
ncbi:hypothetical protein LOS88_13795 [Aeromonas veronii]|uniref:hypothetical protein n=1 Tax=Aeromonas veronii TaxID=654 RepID=UPI001FCFFA17|nr:hypothetical protein [Aeromonas veronii]MCJ7978450.1 hypothetical protein [Aeromonas veronii]UOR17302.1 hypothetical protein LOS88_13795 [Aeromonas veronii]